MGKPTKPNILVIWGDDIGMWNLSLLQQRHDGIPDAEHRPPRTRRHDVHRRVRRAELHRGARLVHHRAERLPHGPVARSACPASTSGLQAEDPTIAELLKAHGYATGQFGKNHLGDLNKYLPTVHGFDEFFGNLYHLNAEEEPEDPDYPDPKQFPQFRASYGPRGVLRCRATDKDDPTEQPRWGRVGKQIIEDTGPLTRKRMETCDDEFVAAAKDFIKRQHEAGKPFFCWLNTTHMHFRTHPKPESVGQAGPGQSPYHDTMIDHDKNVGELLDLLDRARHRARTRSSCTAPITGRT